MAPMPDEIVFISICLKQQYGEDVVDRHASVHFVSNIISDLNKPNDIGWIRQSYKQKKKKDYFQQHHIRLTRKPSITTITNNKY